KTFTAPPYTHSGSLFDHLPFALPKCFRVQSRPSERHGKRLFGRECRQTEQRINGSVQQRRFGLSKLRGIEGFLDDTKQIVGGGQGLVQNQHVLGELGRKRGSRRGEHDERAAVRLEH